MPWRQWLPTPLTGQGWRKAAATNTIIVFLAAVLLVILLAVSWAKSAGLHGNVFVYQGDCGRSRVIDIMLHLIINIVSSLVLASSNFFVQILSSPTRDEVDKAHASKRALQIGNTSIMTFFRLSMFKKVFLVLFLLSSLPFHLFFNGSVFSTSYASADYRLTIASESFPNGAQYFSLGAIALLPPDSHNELGDGLTVNNSDYLISWTAKNARSWKRIGVFECVSQYVACYPRTSYRDIVMVVQSTNSSYWFGGNSSFGWSTESLLAPPPGTNSDQFAESFGFSLPQSASNSLLFSANCSSIYGKELMSSPLSCQQTCGAVVGQSSEGYGGRSITSGENEYKFSVTANTTSYDNGWTFKARDAGTVGLEYCLVEELYQSAK